MSSFHGHNHSHIHSHDSHGHDATHDSDVQRPLRRALAVTGSFMAIEAVGGFFSNSLALLSDATHMLTDVGAILLALFASWVAKRPKTLAMSFGYHRAEILGALASGLVIWFISGLLIFEAFGRLRSAPPVHAQVVVAVATAGLVANLLNLKLLHAGDRQNMSIRAAYLHVLSDALGSMGAMVSGIILWATGWTPIDPIMTILFAILILVSSWRLVRESVGVLMEFAPSGIEPGQVFTSLCAITGVEGVHDLHIWAVSPGQTALSVHLICSSTENVLSAAHQVLKSKFNIQHSTIQIENPSEYQSEKCFDCSPS